MASSPSRYYNYNQATHYISGIPPVAHLTPPDGRHRDKNETKWRRTNSLGSTLTMISTSSFVWFHRSFGFLSLPGGGVGPLPPPFPRPPTAAILAAAAVAAAPPPRPAPPEAPPLGAPRPPSGTACGGTGAPGCRRTTLLNSLSISCQGMILRISNAYKWGTKQPMRSWN